jgi:F0F1-type ATP synthase assembly protein I
MDNNKQPDQGAGRTRVALKSAFIGLRTGCLTFVLAGSALVVGMLLDTRLDTYPKWTLILLGISAPFGLAGVFFMVRRNLKKIKAKEEEHDEIDPG